MKAWLYAGIAVIALAAVSASRADPQGREPQSSSFTRYWLISCCCMAGGTGS